MDGIICSISMPSLLSDVIHGTVLRGFKGPDGSRFMSHQRNLASMMNVDWFQPFKRLCLLFPPGQFCVKNNFA